MLASKEIKVPRSHLLVNSTGLEAESNSTSSGVNAPTVKSARNPSRKRLFSQMKSTLLQIPLVASGDAFCQPTLRSLRFSIISRLSIAHLVANIARLTAAIFRLIETKNRVRTRGRSRRVLTPKYKMSNVEGRTVFTCSSRETHNNTRKPTEVKTAVASVALVLGIFRSTHKTRRTSCKASPVE
jgi:hypothetical protein